MSAKQNHNYGRLVDGKLTYAPVKLQVTRKDEQGNDVSMTSYNPSDYLYRLNGYLPVIVDPYPEDGTKPYEPVCVQENGTIYQHWQEKYLPPPPPTIEEQVEANAEAIMELAELIGGMLQ